MLRYYHLICWAASSLACFLEAAEEIAAEGVGGYVRPPSWLKRLRLEDVATDIIRSAGCLATSTFQ
jgi:hypothetical protein